VNPGNTGSPLIDRELSKRSGAALGATKAEKLFRCQDNVFDIDDNS
jgi:hypothetical protein